jgi:excisionase family DNA binding protein
MPKRYHSTFDYSLVLSRKNRYLVVASPDFGYRVASIRLDLGQASAESIGNAVLAAWSRICQRLTELERAGASSPRPRRIALLGRDMLSTGEAARCLGLSPATLRRLARQGRVPSERTPSGHLRFALDELVGPSLSQPSHPTSNPSHKEAV